MKLTQNEIKTRARRLPKPEMLRDLDNLKIAFPLANPIGSTASRRRSRATRRRQFSATF